MAKEKQVSDKLAYRLITGPDDHAFCKRICDALADGYELYGSPAITCNDGVNIVAQAVVLTKKQLKIGF